VIYASCLTLHSHCKWALNRSHSNTIAIIYVIDNIVIIIAIAIMVISIWIDDSFSMSVIKWKTTSDQ
jgi:hypothetical protein